MVIEDVYAMWNGCRSEIELYAETEDGKELLMATIHCDEPPTFANEELPIDATDYGEWYDEALEEARTQGFVLGFQTEGTDKEEIE